MSYLVENPKTGFLATQAQFIKTLTVDNFFAIRIILKILCCGDLSKNLAVEILMKLHNKFAYGELFQNFTDFYSNTLISAASHQNFYYYDNRPM